MAVSVESLIAQTRLASGLRSNRLFSDDQIAEFLTDGYADLRDKLIVRFASWFKATVDFSLTNGEAGSVFDLATVPDFQMAQGLDLLNGDSPPWTVPMLDSFAERNRGNALWPLASSWSYSGFLGRSYWIDGDTLTVYPSPNAAGNYRLIYTPMLKSLALPVTRTFAVQADDIDAPNQWTFHLANFVAGEVGSVITPAFTQVTRTFATDPADTPSANHWAFANAAFTSADVGGTLTPNLAAPNAVFNVAYTIVAVLSGTFVQVTPNPAALGTFTGPAAGDATVAALSNSVFNVPYTITDVITSSSIAVTPDPTTLGTFTTPPTGTVGVASPVPGTIDALPQPLTPWSRYVVLYASRIIRTSRQQDTVTIDRQFEEISARVVALTKQRSEGVKQAPIQRGWGSGGGFGGGGMR
jgi:hypothetical protein